MLLVSGCHDSDQHVKNGQLGKECGTKEVKRIEDVFKDDCDLHSIIKALVTPSQATFTKLSQEHLVLKEDSFKEHSGLPIWPIIENELCFTTRDVRVAVDLQHVYSCTERQQKKQEKDSEFADVFDCVND